MNKLEQSGLQMKYFVLKPRGNTPYHNAARHAMRTYADMIRHENSILAAELALWAAREENAADAANESLELTKNVTK